MPRKRRMSVQAVKDAAASMESLFPFIEAALMENAERFKVARLRGVMDARRSEPDGGNRTRN